MKTKHLIIVLSFVIFNSCIVKSLKPFYIQEAVEFQEVLLGKWEDKSKATWQIVSLKDIYIEEKKDSTYKPSEEDLKFYEQLKDGYFVGYLEKDQDEDDAETFIAMPFKIKNEILIDFIPFDVFNLGTSDLLENHLLKTHSVAKLETIDNDEIKLTWLDSSKINDLYEENKIKLKREIVGAGDADSDYVLSASSKELYKFLEKYIDSDIENKWTSDTKFTLNKVSDYTSLIEILTTN